MKTIHIEAHVAPKTERFVYETPHDGTVTIEGDAKALYGFFLDLACVYGKTSNAFRDDGFKYLSDMYWEARCVFADAYKHFKELC